MKILPQILQAYILAFTIPTLTTGCKTPVSAEQAAYTTVAAANTGFKTALQLWAVSYAKREAANEATKTTDPGGYLERHNALLKEDGRIRIVQANFTASERLVVETWLAAKSSGIPVPPDPKPSQEMLSSITEVKFLTK